MDDGFCQVNDEDVNDEDVNDGNENDEDRNDEISARLIHALKSCDTVPAFRLVHLNRL